MRLYDKVFLGLGWFFLIIGTIFFVLSVLFRWPAYTLKLWVPIILITAVIYRFNNDPDRKNFFNATWNKAVVFIGKFFLGYFLLGLIVFLVDRLVLNII